MEVLSGWVLFDDRGRIAVFQECSEGVAVVGCVGQQGSGRRKRCDQISRRADVAALAWSDGEGDQAPIAIDDGVDFAGSVASAPADSLLFRPPLPPALQRWALVVVLSMH
jgi:hypothetical protein